MRAAKQIVFRYNGDPTTEESDLDMDGDKSVPEQGKPPKQRGATCTARRALVCAMTEEQSERWNLGPDACARVLVKSAALGGRKYAHGRDHSDVAARCECHAKERFKQRYCDRGVAVPQKQ
jgi:hypothetical protein